uniref:Protein-serine/threonine kinase n=1 Tax=Pseudo-nitzschia delicatissima TaxID=44447 RepID=A0A7S0YCT3_9STRA|mmetsp:Transcript_76/g.172  ORF Transcript_76/g.172 Transcript_76/m.172 type:complete len:611 (+) Transcript_76:135-1967(+)
MTCSRILATIGTSQRRRSMQSFIGASTNKQGVSRRGIGTRSLPSSASSSSSTASPTRILMSPLITNQNQSDHPNLLSLEQPLHQKHGRKRALRQAYTYAAAHPLISRNKNPTASGWNKPIVSSSLSFSSYAEPTNPSESSSSTSDETMSILSNPLETTASISENTVGVDMEELLKLASKKTTPLSLKDMYKYAIVDADSREQRIRNAQFLHSELPVRVAQRAVDLLTLPHGLNEIPAVLQVAHVYLLYLEKFQDCPVPTGAKSEDSFTDMLQSMILERSSIPNAIARGVDEWMRDKKSNTDDADKSQPQNECREQVGDSANGVESKRRLKEMEDALYRFFTARVGLRFLTEHHILSSPTRAEQGFVVDKSIEDADKDSFLGCIEPNCCPTREVRKVVEAVRRQTMDYYGDGVCPEIQIVDGDIASQQQQHQKQKKRHETDNFTYVPHHLHYMVGELLKNSCRATVKRHLENGDTNEKIPPIKIVIVKGVEDVTIKIADRGGGIPRSQMAEIWRFAHSTALKDEIEHETDFGVDEITGEAIRGFGLPLARIYARYLGGELTLKSLEGYGLDAYLHLPRLGDNCENLPLPVQFSPSNLNSNPLRSSFKAEHE